MRVINGWVVSVSSAINGRGHFFNKMVKHGFYTIKNSFFEEINDPYLKQNKDGNRPFYYCIPETIQDIELFWMIPLSSQVEKYQNIIDRKSSKNKPTDGLYICTLPSGNKSAFLIQDIFPVIKNDIEREYTLGNNHMILPYDSENEAILKKAEKVRNLILHGVKLTPTSPDVIKIYNRALNR